MNVGDRLTKKEIFQCVIAFTLEKRLKKMSFVSRFRESSMNLNFSINSNYGDIPAKFTCSKLKIRVSIGNFEQVNAG